MNSRHLKRAAALATAVWLHVSPLAGQNAGETTRSGAATKEAAIQLSAFEVEAARTHEYRATNSFSATRMSVPLSEVPFNVAIITEDFMVDTASFGGDGDVGFSGGANRAAVSWNAAVNGKSVRGFNTLEFMRNGFLRYSDNGAATIERIEILKGPTSVLDGVTDPGGVINVITKQPRPDQNFVKARAAFGSDDKYVATVDVNNVAAPRRADGKPLLSYRIVGSLEGGKGQSKHRVRKLENIMPSVLFQPTSNTSFMAQWEYYRVDGERGNDIDGFNRTVRIDHPSGLHGDVPVAVLFPGVDPYMSWDGPDHKQPEWLNDVFARFEHKFSSDLVATAEFNNHKRQRRWGPHTTQTGIFQAGGAAGTNYNHAAANANPVMRRAWTSSLFDQEVRGLRLNLAYKVDAFGGEHRFVTGRLSQVEDQRSFNNQFRNPGTTQLLFEFFNPRDPNPDLRMPSRYEFFGATEYTQNHFETISYYLNHHARWFNGRVSTLWGLYRADLLNEFDTRAAATNASIPGRARKYETGKTLPQIGFIVDVGRGVSLYANHSQSMKGNSGAAQLDGFGNAFGPTGGEIYEVGSKVALLDSRLLGTFSIYRISENDRVINDPNAPNRDNPTADPNLPRGANVQVGQVVAEGFDADLYFYPIANFTTVFSYAYNKREVTKDPVASRRGPLNGFKHKATIVNKYTWRQGALRGLSANLNVQYVWDQVRETNRFGAPSYIETRPAASVGVSYAWKWQNVQYRATVHGQDLLTTRRASGYIPGTRDAYYLENPKRYLASIDLEF